MSPPTHRRAAAEKRVIELMGIPGPPGQETGVAQYLIDRLREAGLGRSCIARDNAHRRSPFGGACGNLIVRLPGSPGRTGEPRRLLMAHMDTVPLAVGCRPVRRGRRIVSAARGAALGGDNRSGSAALLTALLEILDGDLPHPPLTFLWCVQEEVGLCGARFAALGKLGRPAMGFNFDGRDPSLITIGATGAYRMSIRVRGVAAHAGVHPERGVSATAIAGLAIADLQRHGWHGLIDRRGVRGTSNIGAIVGGQATNVVTDDLMIRAEARSHDKALRRRIVTAYREAFAAAARSVRNEGGRCGSVSFEVRDDYEAFQLDRDEPCVEEARRAVEALGMTPRFVVANGGLDANWLNARGIPTVTLNCGQHEIHTVNEYLDLDEFHRGCGLALLLACGLRDPS